mmetsp:Transcript_118736/g.265114  ORF Transcript_118736/g.265114 Transcript_118736/m.265114 type:complete len:254 (+) Transcript_118736:53-814(+)
MPTLDHSRNDKTISYFQAVAGAPAKLAQEMLKRYGWSWDHAVDAFFAMGHSYPSMAATPGAGAARKLDEFFQKFRAPDEDCIRADGIEDLCTDLGISTLDPVTLVLSYHCRAQQMGVFTREEFMGGMQRLGCDDIHKLRSKLGDLRAMLNDRTQCKEIYAFTFHFALDPGQRCLPAEMCIEFWKLLLRAHFALLDSWLSFVEQRVKNTISKDTWLMLYDLATQVKPDLSDYDMNGAWPVLIDEFVEEVKKKSL